MLDVSDTPSGMIARLDASLAKDGEDCTLRRKEGSTLVEKDVTVRAAVRGLRSNELVGSANQIVPREWWQSGVQTTVHVALRERRGHEVNEALLSTGSGSLLTWSWYAVNGNPTVSEFGVKLREAWSALTLAAPDSRAYVVSVAAREARQWLLRPSK